MSTCFVSWWTCFDFCVTLVHLILVRSFALVWLQIFCRAFGRTSTQASLWRISFGRAIDKTTDRSLRSMPFIIIFLLLPLSKFESFPSTHASLSWTSSQGCLTFCLFQRNAVQWQWRSGRSEWGNNLSYCWEHYIWQENTQQQSKQAQQQRQTSFVCRIATSYALPTLGFGDDNDIDDYL